MATEVLYSGELPDLENKVKTAKLAYNYHKRETETRQNTFENTYQKAVTDAEANLQATKTAEGDVNKIVLPDGFLEAAQEYYVADENSKAAAAQKLYEAYGFHHCGTRRLYYESTGLTDFLFYDYPI